MKRIVRAKSGLANGVESVNEASAVDIKRFENLNHGFEVLIGLLRPGDDIQVFFAVFQSLNDVVQQFVVFSEVALQKAKIATV
jgi:hypothetical protein